MYKKCIKIVAVLVLLSGCSPFCRLINLMPSEKLKEVTFENKVINSEFKFYYPGTSKNEYLRKLRVDYGLDTITLNYENEIDKIKILLDWTNKQWTHDGSSTPTISDPLKILEKAKEGNNFCCVEYGIVLAAALNSIGIPSRVLTLKTADVEKVKFGTGHVVAETYLKEFKKWIFIDGQCNAIPILNNIPLNSVEFQKAIKENMDDLKIINATGDMSTDEKEQYIVWIRKYLFYHSISFDNRYIAYEKKIKIHGKSKLMLVPLNADNPTVFQRKEKIDYCLYTNNINDFYQKPSNCYAKQ